MEHTNKLREQDEDKQKPKGGIRSALLSSIVNFKKTKLKRAVTVDKSAPAQVELPAINTSKDVESLVDLSDIKKQVILDLVDVLCNPSHVVLIPFAQSSNVH